MRRQAFSDEVDVLNEETLLDNRQRGTDSDGLPAAGDAANDISEWPSGVQRGSGF